MQFYIYENGAMVEKKANLQAISEDVKDETLDTASVQLFFDENADGYAPRTLCKMVYNDSSVESGKRSNYYFVATDNVAIQTLSPRTYKHTLTLVQTTRKLSHYVLPNMVISKPRESVVSTYFANENSLNPLYYKDGYVDDPPSGINAFNGFISRFCWSPDKSHLPPDPIYTYLRDDSPYWAECVALSSHTKAVKARIKVFFSAIKHTSSTTMIKLCRDIACPSWLTPYLCVYWSKDNINGQRQDGDITKVQIAKVKLSSVTWADDYGYIDLNETQLELLNSHTDGYVACELISEATGNIPSELYDESEGKYYKSAYSRLFTDVSEFINNNIQTIWSNVSLELSYQSITLYDTLQRIIDRQQCKNATTKTSPLFYLPTSGSDYETLINTESPEFSFSNLTVFEAVSQVLETIDALPRFDCNDSGKLTLALDYFASTGTQIGSGTKFTSYKSNITEQKRDNGILTNFQKAEALCHFPCKANSGKPVYARANVSSYGLPSLSDFVLAVDKPIKYIKHLWVKMGIRVAIVYQMGTYSRGDVRWGTKEETIYIPIDLSSFIFDESTYSSALSQVKTYPNKYTYNVRLQMNCLHFKQGNKYIEIGNKASSEWNKVFSMFSKCCEVSAYRFIGDRSINYDLDLIDVDNNKPMLYSIIAPSDFDFANIWFSCEYVSDISGRLEIQSPFPKESGQFISSTSSSSPDLGKLGLNMLGMALKSGEPTMTCSQMLTKWENRIKVGDIFAKNNERWIATKASYTLLGADSNSETIKGTIEFTKNFNGLSKRIAIDQSKRLYNIDRSISDLCEVNITNYFYVEPKPNNDTAFVEDDGDLIGFDMKRFAFMVMRAFVADETRYYNVSYALLSSPTIDNGNRYIPLSVYGSGNCLCFEAKYSDPISCGIQMTASKNDTDNLWWVTYASKVMDSYYYNGSDVKYCDDEGYSDTFTISYHANIGTMTDFPTTFPNCDGMTNGLICGEIKNLEFNKQPNEIFGLNYEIAFLSRYHRRHNEVFFGRAFFDTWNELKQRKTTSLRYYFSSKLADIYGYSSTKGKGQYFDNVGVACEYTKGKGGNFSFAYSLPYISTISSALRLYSFAVCDQDDNILIACNCHEPKCFIIFTKGKAIVNIPSLHFFAKQERL